MLWKCFLTSIAMMLCVTVLPVHSADYQLIEEATELAKKKDYAKAVSNIEKWLETNKEDRNEYIIYLDLGDYQNAQNHQAEAIAAYKKSLLIKKNADAACALADLYFDRKEYRVAIANYSIAIELNKSEKHFFFNRGGCYHKEKEYVKALDDFLRYCELAPQDDQVKGRYAVGDCYFRLKEYEKALPYLLARKEDPKASHLIASCYQKLKQYQKAKEYLDKAIAKFPDDKTIYRRRARINEDLELWKECIADFDRYYELIDGVTPRRYSNRNPNNDPVGKTWALLIAADKYQVPIHNEDDIPGGKLGLLGEARILQKTLTDGGADVRVLFDEQATKDSILDSIKLWLSKAKPNDLVLICWGNHGYLYGFTPYDNVGKVGEERVISMPWLTNALGDYVRANRIVCISEACGGRVPVGKGILSISAADAELGEFVSVGYHFIQEFANALLSERFIKRAAFTAQKSIAQIDPYSLDKNRPLPPMHPRIVDGWGDDVDVEFFNLSWNQINQPDITKSQNSGIEETLKGENNLRSISTEVQPSNESKGVRGTGALVVASQSKISQTSERSAESVGSGFMGSLATGALNRNSVLPPTSPKTTSESQVNSSASSPNTKIASSTAKIDKVEQTHLLKKQAINAWKRGEHSKALTSFRRIVELDEKNAEAFFSIGVISEDQKRTNAAIFAYKCALEIEPDNQTYRNALQALLSKKKEIVRPDSDGLSMPKNPPTKFIDKPRKTRDYSDQTMSFEINPNATLKVKDDNPNVLLRLEKAEIIPEILKIAFSKMSCLETAEIGSNYTNAMNRWIPLMVNGRTAAFAINGLANPAFRLKVNNRPYSFDINLPSLAAGQRKILVVTDKKKICAVDVDTFDTWLLRLTQSSNGTIATARWYKLDDMKNRVARPQFKFKPTPTSRVW